MKKKIFLTLMLGCVASGQVLGMDDNPNPFGKHTRANRGGQDTFFSDGNNDQETIALNALRTARQAIDQRLKKFAFAAGDENIKAAAKELQELYNANAEKPINKFNLDQDQKFLFRAGFQGDEGFTSYKGLAQQYLYTKNPNNASVAYQGIQPEEFFAYAYTAGGNRLMVHETGDQKYNQLQLIIHDLHDAYNKFTDEELYNLYVIFQEKLNTPNTQETAKQTQKIKNLKAKKSEKLATMKREELMKYAREYFYAQISDLFAGSQNFNVDTFLTNLEREIRLHEAVKKTQLVTKEYVHRKGNTYQPKNNPYNNFLTVADSGKYNLNFDKMSGFFDTEQQKVKVRADLNVAPLLQFLKNKKEVGVTVTIQGSALNVGSFANMFQSYKSESVVPQIIINKVIAFLSQGEPSKIQEGKQHTLTLKMCGDGQSASGHGDGQGVIECQLKDPNTQENIASAFVKFINLSSKPNDSISTEALQWVEDNVYASAHAPAGEIPDQYFNIDPSDQAQFGKKIVKIMYGQGESYQDNLGNLVSNPHNNNVKQLIQDVVKSNLKQQKQHCVPKLVDDVIGQNNKIAIQNWIGSSGSPGDHKNLFQHLGLDNFIQKIPEGKNQAVTTNMIDTLTKLHQELQPYKRDLLSRTVWLSNQEQTINLDPNASNIRYTTNDKNKHKTFMIDEASRVGIWGVNNPLQILSSLNKSIDELSLEARSNYLENLYQYVYRVFIMSLVNNTFQKGDQLESKYKTFLKECLEGMRLGLGISKEQFKLDLDDGEKRVLAQADYFSKRFNGKIVESDVDLMTSDPNYIEYMKQKGFEEPLFGSDVSTMNSTVRRTVSWYAQIKNQNEYMLKMLNDVITSLYGN